MAVEYIPVSQSASDSDEKDCLSPEKTSFPARWRCSLLILGAVLLGSLCANTFFVYREIVRPWELLDELPTQYAGLRRDVLTEVNAHSDFDSVNRTIQDAAWSHVDLEPWNGFLALDEDYAMAQGLPHSQRWPWDSSKGVYIMTSSHEIHCVHALRVLVNEDHDGVPENQRTWHYPHLMHCLNVLRESIMCNADDTPLYIGRLHKNINEESPRAGTGTIKTCRNWNKLQAWSRERSACYRPVHWAEEGFKEIDRYKSCPSGAKPWEQLEKLENIP